MGAAHRKPSPTSFGTVPYTPQRSGSIVIETDGKVMEHHLDATSALTPALTAFLDQTIRGWRFEPVKVDGVVVRAKVPMHLRLVAKKTDDGKYNVSIASTYFGSEETTPHPVTDSVRMSGRPKSPG